MSGKRDKAILFCSLLHCHRIFLHLIFQARNQVLDDRHRSLQGLATIEVNSYLRVLITLGKEGELHTIRPWKTVKQLSILSKR